MTTQTTSQNIKTIPTADFVAVKAALAGYLEGLENGSFSRITDSFWDDATMHGFTADGLLAGSYKNLDPYVEQFGAAPASVTHLDVLAITPSAAVVRIDMEGAADGTDYTDFHMLLKQDGVWKVQAKLFHQYGI
ncbi:nuclear transport factor 2 family protein [Microbacterium sp. 22303]|uniref:nuclear transport factor 2 family protein n=1 Tax=Microbacterium sp. 22303 TaxID=3453905 RepID=UPI003F833A12